MIQTYEGAIEYQNDIGDTQDFGLLATRAGRDPGCCYCHHQPMGERPQQAASMGQTAVAGTNARKTIAAISQDSFQFLPRNYGRSRRSTSSERVGWSRLSSSELRSFTHWPRGRGLSRQMCFNSFLGITVVHASSLSISWALLPWLFQFLPRNYGRSRPPIAAVITPSPKGDGVITVLLLRLWRSSRIVEDHGNKGCECCCHSFPQKRRRDL